MVWIPSLLGRILAEKLNALRLGSLPWCLAGIGTAHEGLCSKHRCGRQGHMVLFSHAACSTDADLGILFHAKEHPEEFTSRIGRVLPVCSPEAGGLSDPRRGTKLSIAQPSFRDRNFLWLLSLNTTFRVDSSHTSLLAPGAAGSRFFTVDESHFGHQLGTVCYLSQDPAEPKGERDVLCIPCHGFPADWHLAQALRALRALRREAEEAEEAEAEEVEVEAVRRAPLDSELVALLQRPTEGKRLRRLGSPRTRRRLLVHVERELLGFDQARYGCLAGMLF